MNKNSEMVSCAVGSWVIAAFAGVLCGALLLILGGWMFIQAVFMGGVLFVVSGALISWLICRPLSAPGDVTIGGSAAAKAAAPAPSAAPAKSASAAPAAAAPEPAATPKPAAAKPAPAAKADDSAADETQPETLSAPRDGGADDLKKLKGVGPKLEQTLNELGFYHFDQVAAWTTTEVAWIDSRLKFKGRIERDGWIEQAKILAKGGETEFSARKK